MPMPRKPATGGDPILIDDPQTGKFHMARIVIIGKGKCMITIQPAVIGVAAVSALTQGDHGLFYLLTQKTNFIIVISFVLAICGQCLESMKNTTEAAGHRCLHQFINPMILKEPPIRTATTN